MAYKILFSIGHSNKSMEQFAERLLTYCIHVVVDIRTNPASRFVPHYNQIPLSDSLEAYGIVYEFKGHNLGGKSPNINFDETINEISERSEYQNIALMCSEADFRKCHRYLELEPKFRKNGVTMKHIEYL